MNNSPKRRPGLSPGQRDEGAKIAHALAELRRIFRERESDILAERNAWLRRMYDNEVAYPAELARVVDLDRVTVAGIVSAKSEEE